MGTLGPDNTGKGSSLIWGQWVLIFGCFMATLPVFAAFLPIDLGILPREEPMAMALYLSAGLCAIGLVLTFVQARELALQALSHPLVLLAFAIALWSALTAPFAEYPWPSLLGDEVFGEATIRYAMLGVFFASAFVLAANRRLFRALCVILLGVSFVAPIVMFIWAQGFFVSLDLVGYFAIPAVIGVWLLTNGLKPYWRIPLALVAVVPAFALSSNLSVILVLSFVAAPASAATYWLLRKRPDNDGLARCIGVVAVVVAPVLGLLVKWLLPDIVDVPSVQSRHLLDKVMWAGIMDNPWILAIGQGWGAVNLTMDSFAPLAGATMWDGSWDLASRNVSHSHSIYMEALLGAGLPALAGLVTMIAAPLLLVKREDLPLAVFAVFAVAGMGTVTGEFPSTVAAVALAFALAGRRSKKAHGARAVRAGHLSALLMPVIAALLLAASFWQFNNTDENRARIADVRAQGRESPFFCKFHPHAAVYADTALAQGLIKSYRTVFARAAAGESILIEDLWQIDSYVCTAEARIATSRSSSLQLAMETFRVEVALGQDGSELPARYQETLNNWSVKLARMLTVAPYRSDAAIGFFLAQFQRGRLYTVRSLAEALLKRDPEDPVALYFQGLSKIRAGGAANRDAGMELLQRAVDAKVQRFLPVQADVLTEIRLFKPVTGG